MSGEHGLGWVAETRTQMLRYRVASTVRRVGGPPLVLPQPGQTFQVDEPLWILDQDGDPSCTGHNAVEVLYGLTGVRLSPEMAWLYALLQSGEKLSTIRKRGVAVSKLLLALAKHGTCPYDMYNRHRADYEFGKLPDGVPREEAQRYNLRAQVIRGSGRALSEQFADSVGRGRPGGVVIAVDSAVDECKDDTPIGPRSGPIRGYHIITPWLSRCTASGKLHTGCVNSWGKDSGGGGIIWLTEERAAESPFSYIGLEAA